MYLDVTIEATLTSFEYLLHPFRLLLEGDWWSPLGDDLVGTSI